MKREPKNERGGRGGGVEEGNGLKRQLYKACIDRSGLLRFHAVYAFQNTKQKYLISHTRPLSSFPLHGRPNILLVSYEG